MSFKNLLRERLLRHHDTPFVRQLARGICTAGLKGLVTALARRRGVSSILLRRGMASGDWVPGGSDYDLAVIAEDACADEVASYVYRTARRFNSIWPVPAEVLVFSISELDNYFAEGNIRAVEGQHQWKALHGKIPNPGMIRPASEISALAISECLDQWASLCRLAIKREWNRANTRHFLKHLCDVFIFGNFARTGRYEKQGSRWNGLSLMADEKLREELAHSLQHGFQPLADKTIYASVQLALQFIHATCEHLPFDGDPAWSLTPIETGSAQRDLQRSLWLSLAEQAERMGVPLRAFHFHQRLYLLLADQTVESGRLPIPELLRLARMASGTGAEAMFLSRKVMDALSITIRYQHETFFCNGMRLELEAPEKTWWVIPKSSELTRLSLVTKRCTLPAELRRLRTNDPEEAKRVAAGYAKELHAQLQR